MDERRYGMRWWKFDQENRERLSKLLNRPRKRFHEANMEKGSSEPNTNVDYNVNARPNCIG